MNSATDLESGQGAQAAPRAGAFRSLSTPLSSARSVNVLYYEAGAGGSDTALPVREHNVSDQPTQTGQGSSQAEAQIRAYFLMIAEMSLA